MMEKLRKYIDKEFVAYPRSRALDELKEELLVTLLERYNESLSGGASEDVAFSDAIATIGDCKEAVKLIESGIDKKTKRLRLGMAIFGSLLYWLLAVTIYLTASLISHKWGLTWIIFPIATAIYLCVAFAIVFPKGRSLDKNTRIRVSAMLAILILTLAVYFLSSFFTRVWTLTWIAFPIGISFGMAFDAGIIRKSNKVLFAVYVHIITLLVTNAVYQLISYYQLVSWSLSWLIFLFAIIGLIIYNFVKILVKYNEETSFAKK